MKMGKGKTKGKEDKASGSILGSPAEIENAQLKLQLEVLRSKLKLADTKSQNLQTEKNKLKTRLEQQRADQHDIFYSLQKKIEDSEDKIVDLENRLHLSEKTNKGENSEDDDSISQVHQQYLKREKELQQQVDSYKTKLYELEEFANQKEEMEKTIQRLEQGLLDEKKQHELDVTRLERTNVQEKERLKREMLIKIKETKTYLLSLTEDQLDTTTKRTIMENEQMLTELQYQSKETERVITQCESLEKQKKEISLKYDLLKNENKSLAKKSNMVNKLVKRLKNAQAENLFLTKVKEKPVELKKEEQERKVDKMRITSYLQKLAEIVENNPIEEIRESNEDVKRILHLLTGGDSNIKRQNIQLGKNDSQKRRARTHTPSTSRYTVLGISNKDAMLKQSRETKVTARAQSVIGPVRPWGKTPKRFALNK